MLWATSIVSAVMTAAVPGAVSDGAQAQEVEAAQVSFNIPSQPVGLAMAALGRQSGLQISLATSSGSGISTNAVSGTMDPYAALSQMLDGTGLYWWVSEAGTVIISSTEAAVTRTGEDGEEVLDLIVVTDNSGTGYAGTPDWVYETADSVSVITSEAIADSGVRGTNQLFNSVAGAYQGATVGSFPTVSPNLRGLQDAGRVVVSIEGARQNAQDGGRYGGTSTGGIGLAFVDTSFVRAVDITKKTGASANNAGSLGGTVDFRLVGADDIIEPGKSWGMEVEGGAGTNGYEFDGSFVGAMRLGEVISVTLGASRKRMGTYEPGENGVADGRYDLTYRRSWSGFAKVEAELEEVTASLSWLHQHNAFRYSTTADGNGSSFDVGSNTVVADIGWTPDNTLIDLSGKLWAQTTSNDETREARSSSAETSIATEFTSFGFILDNTSELSTSLGALSLDYGVEAFRDVSNKQASSTSIDSNPMYENSYGSWSPPGRRDVASAFLNGTLEPVNWLSVSGGLRYDWYRLKGTSTYSDQTTSRTAYVVQSVISRYDYLLSTDPSAAAALPPILVTIFSAQMGEAIDGSFVSAGQTIYSSTTTVNSETLDIERSDGAWLPSATVELAPFDWFKPYASYSQSFRPPTISETFASGSLSPGDYVGTSLAPNLDLAPEKARTFELGANVFTNDLLTPGDSLRIKASAFYREIEDYIVVGDIVPDAQVTHTYYGFVNLDGTTQMKGIELEGNYDAGVAWFGASLTLLDVDWPQKTDRFSNSNVSTTGETIFFNSEVPPRQKLVLNAGVRLFDRRLSLGARVSHVTATEAATLDSEGNPLEVYGDPYTTLDLFGSFKANDHAVLRFSANNVTDINYVPPNSTYVAPGRTVQASLTLRF